MCVVWGAVGVSWSMHVCGASGVSTRGGHLCGCRGVYKLECGGGNVHELKNEAD